jgi:hypothetical protein
VSKGKEGIVWEAEQAGFDACPEVNPMQSAKQILRIMAYVFVLKVVDLAYSVVSNGDPLDL